MIQITESKALDLIKNLSEASPEFDRKLTRFLCSKQIVCDNIKDFKIALENLSKEDIQTILELA